MFILVHAALIMASIVVNILPESVQNDATQTSPQSPSKETQLSESSTHTDANPSVKRHNSNELGGRGTCEASSADATLNSSQNHNGGNDVVVVYENDMDDIEDFIFLESRLLSGFTKLCKMFVMVFPALIILLVIVSKLEPDPTSDNTRSNNLGEKVNSLFVRLCH